MMAPALRLREAIGMKIAIATIKDLVSQVGEQKCVDIKRLEWALDELEAYANHIIATAIGIYALEIGRYIGSEILNETRGAER